MEKHGLLRQRRYPFHLRPKHRQALQYLRMATDLARDLELDQEHMFAKRVETGLNREDYAGIRAFISCYYLTTRFVINCFRQMKQLTTSQSFANSFSRTVDFSYTTWLERCCNLLEQNSAIEQDHVLVWLVRLHHISDEMLALQKSYKKRGSQSDHHRHLIEKGLETELRDWQNRIPTTVMLMRMFPLCTILRV